MKKNMKTKINIVCTNEEKPNTCGSCYYTDNDLGLVALHCTCQEEEAKAVHWDEYGKVRSYAKCKRWKERK